MHRPLSTETRLPSRTPHEHPLLTDLARREAHRLHTEAVGAALGSVMRQLRRLLPRLEQRPVRAGLKPCRP